jgi:predicted dehydrogenase
VNDIEKLAGLDLDAVYVTTPISSHSSLVRSIYSGGMAQSIFVEKTLTSDYKQAEELCEIAARLTGKTMVGYMKRFNVVFGKAKELLTQKVLGDVISFKAYAYSSDFLGLEKSAASRGGALRDIGCHVIDLSLYLLGDLSVQEVISGSEQDSGSDGIVSFRVANNSGLDGQFEISQRVPNYRMPEFGLSINCADGRLDVNDDRLILTWNNGGQQKWHRHNLSDVAPFSIGDPEYFRENQHFINSIVQGTPCEPSFKTASKVDQIIDQVSSRS